MCEILLQSAEENKYRFYNKKMYAFVHFTGEVHIDAL